MKIMIWFHVVGAICCVIPLYFMWSKNTGFAIIMLIALGVNIVAIVDYTRRDNRINQQNRNVQVFRQKDLTADAKKTFNPPKQ